MYLVSVSKILIKSILYHFIHLQILNTFYYLQHPSITHFQCTCAAFAVVATKGEQFFAEQENLNRMWTECDNDEWTTICM